jgi:hypothetical protein
LLENDRERKKDDKKENRGIILSGIECFLIEVLCLERCISGHIVFLGIRHFILTDQGKDKPFFRVSQPGFANKEKFGAYVSQKVSFIEQHPESYERVMEVVLA